MRLSEKIIEVINRFKLRKQIFINFMLLMMFVCASLPQQASADETNQRVGFSIKAVPSDKQINKKVSYFDLLLQPGETHLLEVDIFNSGDMPIKTSVTACTAGTNQGGVIDYDRINVTDDSLEVPFEDAATVDEPIISIPANGSSRARIKVKMPDKSIDGTILGGIAVKKIEDEPTEALEDGTTSIQNEYCYVLGVKITMTDTVVQPDFRLRSVGPALSNYHTSIAANLQNFKAAIAKDVKIDAKVYYNDGAEPLYTNYSDDFDIAPNSNFDFVIPCNGKLAEGDYRLMLTAKHDENSWEFDESFTVSATSANDINEQAVNVPAPNYYRIATICLSILLILILIAFITRMVIGGGKKSEKDE